MHLKSQGIEVLTYWSSGGVTWEQMELHPLDLTLTPTESGANSVSIERKNEGNEERNPDSTIGSHY